MDRSFTILKEDFLTLKNHLFPGDGKEAIAFGLCGTLSNPNSTILTLYKLKLIKHDLCERSESQVTWPTSEIIDLLDEGNKKGLALVKFHSHVNPNENVFSKQDNKSDIEIFTIAYNWIDNSDLFHTSIIMLNDGTLIGRTFSQSNKFEPISKFKIIGDEIEFQFRNNKSKVKESYDERTLQVFGELTTTLLKGLKIGIVGCSGTGSPTAEQLCRLGVGEILLIDPDIIEEKNLNRIFCSKRKHLGRFKTEVLKEELDEIESNCIIKSFPVNLYNDKKALLELCSCDVIFSCVDSLDGRHIINQIGTFFLIPIFDLGIKLEAGTIKNGDINKVCFTVNYLRPGQSLINRGVYSVEDLAASTLFRQDIFEYWKNLDEKYIKGINVNSPAVITINTMASSVAINELLARIHKFRFEENSNFAIQRWELVHDVYSCESDYSSDVYLSKFIGRGTISPFLNLTELSSLDV